MSTLFLSTTLEKLKPCEVLALFRASRLAHLALHYTTRYSNRNTRMHLAEQQYISTKNDKKTRDQVGDRRPSCSTALQRDDGPVRRLHQSLKARGTTRSDRRKAVQHHNLVHQTMCVRWYRGAACARGLRQNTNALRVPGNGYLQLNLQLFYRQPLIGKWTCT